MMNFLLGVLFSWWYYYCWGFRGHVGETPRLNVSWQIPYVPVYVQRGQLFFRSYHIHHWMICAAMLLSAEWFPVWPFVRAWCSVGLVHGLSYPDCFKIST